MTGVSGRKFLGGGPVWAALGAAVAFALASCSSTVEADSAETCASHTRPPKRVEDRLCSTSGSGAYGYYRWQFAPGQTFTVPDIGQPLYHGSFGAAPAGAKTTRVSKSGTATISRGGLGVSIGGKSGGS